MHIGVLIDNVPRELLEVETGVFLEGDALRGDRGHLIAELVLSAVLGCADLGLPRSCGTTGALCWMLCSVLLHRELLLLVEEIDLA